MTDRAAAEPEDDFPHGAGNPARGALRHAGYTRLAQLTDVTAAEVLALHGVGPKAIRVLREALAAEGLSFAAE
ncbi:helix-hairpin-helix domain-containing protein [Streptomyces cyaneofuscatus]|uniref:DNA-binding protein n=1 Tax=Streptomyces cyaneofuscatus TaxID=66883 RepID=UPI00363A5271